MSQSHVPCIDLAKHPDAKSLGKAVREALETVGFLTFVNHGLEQESQDLFSMSADLFKTLTPEEKRKFAINNLNKGYAAVGDEILDPEEPKGDGKESFNIGTAATPENIYAMPDLLEKNRAHIFEIEQAFHNMSLRLLEGFAAAVGLPQDSFSKHHRLVDGGVSTLRLLRYVPVADCSKVASRIRAGAHSDYGSLTLLFQSSEGFDGLQIFVNGEWRDVVIPKGALVVNTADQLEYWTSGIMRSTTHRVVLPESGSVPERYSIAFFNHPVPNTLLDPVLDSESWDLKKRVEQKGISLETKLRSHEYLKKRLDATIANAVPA